jgi:FkbM family methyltransferase
LRPFTSDLKVFYQIFGNEEYKAVINIYNQLFLDSPQNIIDLGANVGLASIYLGTEYNSAKFKLIEPSLDNLEIARLNLKLNRIDFSDLEGGAWNKNTMLNLNRDFRDGKEWSINLSENQNGNIKGYSIKDIIDQYDTPIDILKIDIEGAEKILFEDSIYAFGFLEKVKCIALEIHDEYECREMIYNTLKLNGFIYFDTKETTIAVNRKYLMAAL